MTADGSQTGLLGWKTVAPPARNPYPITVREPAQAYFADNCGQKIFRLLHFLALSRDFQMQEAAVNGKDRKVTEILARVRLPALAPLETRKLLKLRTLYGQ